MPDIIGYGITGFACWLIGVSAWHKYRYPQFFAELAADYLGGMAVSAVWLRLLALVEGLVALALLVPAARRLALAASAGILLAYALLMLSRLLAGRREMKCGCAGPASAMILSPALIFRNLLCAALCLAAIEVKPTGLAAGWSGLLSLLVAVFLVMLYLRGEQLISSRQRIGQGT